mgnify:CR=1 FL=1
MKIIKKNILIQAGRARIPGHFCHPPGKGSFPAVVVFHGSDGYKPNHGGVAHRLAREGFAALAPAWFGEDPARAHWDEIRAEDILRIFDWLENEVSVNAGLLGLIGFSRGGGLALVSASLIPNIRAVVNYFGLTSWKGGLEEFPHLPLRKEDPLHFAREVSCPILSFHGDQDTVVPIENTYLLDHACRRFGVKHDSVIYPGVNHSFVWPGDKYNQKAHLDSWDRALRFLRQNLFLS